MNIKITSPDERATVRLSGHNGTYVLRTSFNPFGQRRFVDALDARYRLERVGVMDDDCPGTEWQGEFTLRADKVQQQTLIEDIEEIFCEAYERQ